MYQVISIIFDFWADLFEALNSHFFEIGLNLKEINIVFFEGVISLYDYLILLATLLTVLFVVYVTYKFFVVLYKVVARLWW